jgi:hypothetical protein
MNPASLDIAKLLEDELGLEIGVDLFIGKEPPEPDSCVTIFDTPGFPPQLTYKKGENYYYPAIQIRIRERLYLEGYEKINGLKELLHGRANEVINGTHYTLVQCSIEPALLDWDANNRARFFINFNLQRR